MIKGLLALDSNLASSIALKYASLLTGVIPMHLKAVHVEQEHHHRRFPGNGLVQKSWRYGVLHAGLQKISRLIEAEKTQCSFIGSPKVFIGDRCDNLLNELQEGCYELFLEGNLSTASVDDFYRLISSKLYNNSPTPVLVIKNLVSIKRIAILLGEGTDSRLLTSHFNKIAGKSKLRVDLLTYRYQESSPAHLINRTENDRGEDKTESLLKEFGYQADRNLKICGPPEQAAELFKNYGLAFTAFPSKGDPLLDLLAHIPIPLLLCR